MNRNARKWLVVTFAAVLVLAACGQKQGVSLSANGGGGDGSGFSDDGTGSDGTGSDGTGTDGTGTGGEGGNGEASSGTGGSTGGSNGTGGSTRTRTRTGTGGGTPIAGAPDRTGIDDVNKVIKIGVHAPVTGAAPIEQKTFDKGKDVYWQWLAKNGGLYGGYRVEIKFYDDKFEPVEARRRCAQLVEQDKVFLLIGAAGADQITACANYANSKNVPYLSAGVNTEGLDGLRTYFAVSETYAEQMPKLAQMVKAKIGVKKLGLAVLDSKSFADARAAARKAFTAAGFQIVADKNVGKETNPQSGKSIAGDLQDAGAEIVLALVSPTIFLYIANGAQSEAYFPEYVGPGVTNGLNTVATAGCPAIGKAKFFSPFPQLDAIDSMDPAYRPAYNEFITNKDGSQRPDDIGIALWGLNKSLHQMFKAIPDVKQLSRQSFISTLTSGKTFSTGVYPSVTFSPTDHFGADTVHLLEADCQAAPAQFKTRATFAKSF